MSNSQSECRCAGERCNYCGVVLYAGPAPFDTSDRHARRLEFYRRLKALYAEFPEDARYYESDYCSNCAEVEDS